APTKPGDALTRRWHAPPRPGRSSPPAQRRLLNILGPGQLVGPGPRLLRQSACPGPPGRRPIQSADAQERCGLEIAVSICSLVTSFRFGSNTLLLEAVARHLLCFRIHLSGTSLVHPFRRLL